MANGSINRGFFRGRVHALLTFFAFVALLPLHAHAQAPQCTFTMSNISFGTVDLQKGNAYDAGGSFNYACTGDAREILHICPSFGLAAGGQRWLTDPAGDKLYYNLYSDESRTNIWGTWYDRTYKGSSIDVPLGRSERTSGSVTVYGRIQANQQSVKPGTYSATINKGNVAISYGYASQGNCESFKGGARSSLGFTITANVQGAGAPGAITAPDASHPNGGTAQNDISQPPPKTSVWQKLQANAEYQQRKQQQEAAASAPPGDSASSTTSDDAKQQRASYIESHSCMTTDGADKANQLADECNKVTSSPHASCNIQQNTCEEIRTATQKGCWGLAASGPDFCLTKYR